jgi:DNA invertase Pin-like site-specific DNA recombinase
MSTDMQRYSLENQADAIEHYAVQRGLTIVRSYEDAGRSGLRLEGRDGLKRLISDVRSGSADFNVILVYDVSRWGRFQDADESAYYEFICKQAGIAVEYCAEQFENDSSLTATVLKSIKRAMAGEYSRELSVKTHAGQAKIAALGFRRGGASGYGLRRCLVDGSGRRKTALTTGEWKSIKTDRVILIPGPPGEIETISRIYHMFVDERLSLKAIARHLNADGIPYLEGRRWLPTAVRDVLSNEKYIGNNIFNRTSLPLKTKWRRNPPNEWIRANRVFESIVSHEMFDRAKCLLAENGCYTANELLDYLTALWCQKGALSQRVLKDSKYAPSDGPYFRTFGGLRNACAQIGYATSRAKNCSQNLKFRTAMNTHIVEGIRSRGGCATLLARGFVIRINEEISLSASVARLVTTESGDRRWRLGCKTRCWPDILVVARAAQGHNTLRDYFCLPYIMIGRKWLTFSEGSASGLEPFQMESLTELFEVFGRVPIHAGSPKLRDDAERPIVAQAIDWLTVSVEQAVENLIGRLQALLADRAFIDLLLAQNFRSMPRQLAIPVASPAPPAENYGRSVLDFAVVWAFFSRFMGNATIAAHVHRLSSELPAEMKMAYLAVLASGPLARMRPAMILPKDAPSGPALPSPPH